MIKRNDYVRPTVQTVDARTIVESLGPVSAGSGASMGSSKSPDIMPGH